MSKFSIKSCKECGSTDLQWDHAIVNNSGVQNGLLNTNDVRALHYLGCNACSETLAFAKPEEMHEALKQSEEDNAALRALSVANIMLDVVPGEDGMGEEIYARSVDGVVAVLSKLGDRVETLEDENAALWADLASANADKEAYAQNAIGMRKEVDKLRAELKQKRSDFNDITRRMADSSIAKDTRGRK